MNTRPKGANTSAPTGPPEAVPDKHTFTWVQSVGFWIVVRRTVPCSALEFGSTSFRIKLGTSHRSSSLRSMTVEEGTVWLLTLRKGSDVILRDRNAPGSNVPDRQGRIEVLVEDVGTVQFPVRVLSARLS